MIGYDDDDDDYDDGEGFEACQGLAKTHQTGPSSHD